MKIEEAKNIIENNIIENKIDGPLRLSSRIFNDKGQVPFIQIQGFKELSFVEHGFTTKLGGVSKGIYESLNLGIHLDDDVSLVMENYRRLGQSMGIDYKRISVPNQVHKSNILVAKEEDAGDGVIRPRSHFEIDAQITNVKNLPLIVYTADCVPVLLADPVKRVIASVHAGWRGSVDGICAKTVEKMAEVYGCLPEDIYAVIGPSIGPDNYEVDDTVINAIYKCPYLDIDNENKFELLIDEESKEHKYKNQKYKFIRARNKAHYSIFSVVESRSIADGNRYMLNLWNLNELILVNAGLKIDNIYQTRLCTMKYHDIFFSHRYTNGKRGLQAGIIMIK